MKLGLLEQEQGAVERRQRDAEMGIDNMDISQCNNA